MQCQDVVGTFLGVNQKEGMNQSGKVYRNTNKKRNGGKGKKAK